MGILGDLTKVLFPERIYLSSLQLPGALPTKVYFKFSPDHTGSMNAEHSLHKGPLLWLRIFGEVSCPFSL